MRATATGFSASAPRPYTVSVGKATSAPVSSRRAAAAIAARSSVASVTLTAHSQEQAGGVQIRLCLSQRSGDKGQVAHLAAPARIVLAIQMQARTRQGQDAVPGRFPRCIAVAVKPDIAKDVEHHGRRVLA